MLEEVHVLHPSPPQSSDHWLQCSSISELLPHTVTLLDAWPLTLTAFYYIFQVQLQSLRIFKDEWKTNLLKFLTRHFVHCYILSEHVNACVYIHGIGVCVYGIAQLTNTHFKILSPDKIKRRGNVEKFV